MAQFGNRFNPMSQAANTFSRTTGTPADSSNWESWFGPMPDKPKPSPFSNYPVEHSTLPDAYRGENVFLAEKISGLVNTTGDFWTNRILPWQQSQHIGAFTWSEWHFNQVLASRVPHEGVPRLITASEKKFMTSPIRRGLAAEFEADFANHTKGQIDMARRIQGMVVSIQTTINMDIQHTIIVANDQRKTNFRDTGVAKVPIGFDIDMEITSFNAMGKSSEGFAMLYSKVKRYLLNNGASTPLTLLVTPETPMNMAMNTPVSIPGRSLINKDTSRGPTGDLGRTDIPDGDFVLPDGTNVIEVRDLNIEENAPSEQLFSRTVLIGEYYVINWEERSKSNLYDGCGDSFGGKYVFCSDHRSILIHDAELDKMAKITLKQCIEYGGRETGFPDMDIVQDLAKGEKYTETDFYPSSRNSGNKDNRRNQSSNMKRNAHMMLFYEKGEGTRVVRHFGNMDDNITSDRTFRQIGQTLAALGSSASSADQETADDLVSLMQELENAEYNQVFFEALIIANTDFNENGAGDFVGERLTDRQLIDKYGYDNTLVEWKAQVDGGLLLPDKVDDSLAVPPGMASLAGLYSLSRNTSYGALSVRAKKAILLIQKLYNKWNAALESEVLRADNRSPWWHSRNGMYTFFDNAVYMPRDPLFLASNSRGAGGSGGPGGSALVFNVYNKVQDDEDSLNTFINVLSTMGAAKGSHMEVIYKVLLKMGEDSGIALIGLMKNLNPIEKKAFAEIIIKIKPAMARKIVLGLAQTGVELRSMLDPSIAKKARNLILKNAADSAPKVPDIIPVVFEDPPVFAKMRTANTGGNVGDEDRPLHRAPLVMTPGLARTIDDTVFIVRPSDPASGHTLPLHSGPIPSSVTNRIQYASFVGSKINRAQGKHMSWAGHHLEFIAARQAGTTSSGSFNSSRVVSKGSENLFSTSNTEDSLFSEMGVIESIASATSGRGSYAGAQDSYKWAGPEGTDYLSAGTGGRFDRRRPFGGIHGVGIGNYNKGITPIDETDGERVIFEFDTDNMRKHIAAASKISDNPLVRWGAIAAILSRCDKTDHWHTMLDANILTPCNAVLLRFRQEFLTDSFVLMEAGSNTGGTLFNNASSSIGMDPVTRRLHMNFVFYSKAIIWNDSNIQVIENAQVRRLIRGRGIRFITNIDQIDANSSSEYFDMISVIGPIEENRYGNESSGIGILGNSQLGWTDRNNDLDPIRNNVDYSSAQYVASWFRGGDSISLAGLLEESSHIAHDFIDSQDALPRLVYQGHQQNYNHSKRDWSIIVKCRGHLGINGSYPGVTEVYNRTPTGGFYLKSDPEYPTNVS